MIRPTTTKQTLSRKTRGGAVGRVFLLSLGVLCRASSVSIANLCAGAGPLRLGFDFAALRSARTGLVSAGFSAVHPKRRRRWGAVSNRGPFTTCHGSQTPLPVIGFGSPSHSPGPRARVLAKQARAPLQALLAIAPLLPKQAWSPLQASWSTEPLLPTQAWFPLQALLLMGTLLNEQATNPLQAPLPMGTLLNGQASSPSQAFLPTGPVFPLQALTPLQASWPTGPVLSKQAPSPLQAPSPREPLLLSQARAPLQAL